MSKKKFLSWAGAGLMTLTGVLSYAEPNRNFVNERNNYPIALDEKTSKNPPSISASSDNWQVYQDSKIMGIYTGPLPEHRGKKIVLSESGENPDVYEDFLVYEEKREGESFRVPRKDIYLSKLNTIDFSSLDSQEGNHHTPSNLEKICLTCSLIDSEQIHTSSNPKVSGNTVVFNAGGSPNSATQNKIFMYNISANKLTPISSSSTLKDPPKINSPLIVYAERGNSWNKYNLVGFDVSSGTEFQIESNKNIRRPSVYKDEDLGQFIIAYEDYSNGTGIGIKRVGLDSGNATINPPYNPQEIPDFFPVGNSISGVEVFGRKSEPGKPKVGPYITFKRKLPLSYAYEEISAINLTNQREFNVSTSNSKKSNPSGWVNKNTRRPQISYATNNFQVPTPNFTILSGAGELEFSQTRKSYAAMMKSTIDLDPNPQFCGDYGTYYYPGDLNQDCKVDLADATIFAENWLRKDCNLDNNKCEGTDINMDGRVDKLDWKIYLNNLGKRSDPQNPGYSSISPPLMPLNIELTSGNFHPEEYDYARYHMEEMIYFDHYGYDYHMGHGYYGPYGYYGEYGENMPDPKDPPKIIYEQPRGFSYTINDKTVGGANIEKIEIPTSGILNTNPGDYYHYGAPNIWQGIDNGEKITFQANPNYNPNNDEQINLFIQTNAKRTQDRPISIYTDKGVFEYIARVPVEKRLTGDLNGDGFVDLRDLAKLSKEYGSYKISGDPYYSIVGLKELSNIALDWLSQETWYGENVNH